MEDLTGISKIVDSELVKRAYEDALAEPARQVGHLATDTLKTFRLFTAPIQLLATAQDRFERWLGALRDSVPGDRQIEAAPEIAGPVLMNLRFLSDENKLRHLYLNLLKLAIDRDHQAEAHPGFIKIIEQLSTEDAIFLQMLRQVTPREENIPLKTELPVAYVVQLAGRSLKKWPREKIQASLDLLRGLSVVHFDFGNVADLNGSGYMYVELQLTQFGINFVRSCVPDNWSEETLSL